jgi:hypothetical protein
VMFDLRWVIEADSMLPAKVELAEMAVKAA